jgi:hypothetical protein
MLAALAALDAEDDQTDAEVRADAEARGIDFEAWGAEIKAMAEAKLAAQRRARHDDEGDEDEGERERDAGDDEGDEGDEGERAGDETTARAGAAPAAIGPVGDEDILRDGAASANDVEAGSPAAAALEQAVSPGGRSWAARWHLRRVARALVIGLAAAGIVAAGLAGLGSVALRWVTAQGGSLARKMTARGVDGARAIEGATARAQVLSEHEPGESKDTDPEEPGE